MDKRTEQQIEEARDRAELAAERDREWWSE